MPENCVPHYFEGVEKLLEVWFKLDETSNSNLRHVPRHVWEQLLVLVKCEVIGFSSNEHIDAYLLSESSMFVTDRRWILKTCGTTTPLQCLKPLLCIAYQYGCLEVENLFYSRKNFARPELQIFPHRGFCEEVTLLDSMFDDGRSYCLGSINRDCWYLYNYSKNENKQDLNELGLDYDINLKPDQTIEVLMKDLDPKIMAMFFKDKTSTAEEATIKSEINRLIPEMSIDDFLFEPCGYSMNGISKLGKYMTIHITPEKDFSYVSFESNIALTSYADLISRVVKTFQPGQFIVTMFANKTSMAYTSLQDLECSENLSKWKKTDMQYCNFPAYNLIFAQYNKKNV